MTALEITSGISQSCSTIEPGAEEIDTLPSLENLLKQAYEVHQTITKDLQKQVASLSQLLSQKELEIKNGACSRCTSMKDMFDMYKVSHQQIVSKQETKIELLEKRISDFEREQRERSSGVCVGSSPGRVLKSFFSVMDESLRQSEDGSAVLVWDSETEEGTPQVLRGSGSAIGTALPVKRGAVPETLDLEMDKPSKINKAESPSEPPKEECISTCRAASNFNNTEGNKGSVNRIQANQRSPLSPLELQNQENMYNLQDTVEKKTMERNVYRDSYHPRGKDSKCSPVRLSKYNPVQITQESVSPADSSPSPSLLEARGMFKCPLNVEPINDKASKEDNADAVSSVSVDLTIFESKRDDNDRSQSLLKSLPPPLLNTHALPGERSLPKLSLAKKTSTCESPKSRGEGSSSNSKSLPNRKRKKQTKLSDRYFLSVNRHTPFIAKLPSLKQKGLSQMKVDDCPKHTSQAETARLDETFLPTEMVVTSPITTSPQEPTLAPALALSEELPGGANNSGVPSCSKNAGEQFKFHGSPVRKKAARQCLPGHECKDCQDFFKRSDLTDKQHKELLKKCSRHKAQFAPPPTPDHFWELDFPDTQECKERGYMNVTQRCPPPKSPASKMFQ